MPVGGAGSAATAWLLRAMVSDVCGRFVAAVAYERSLLEVVPGVAASGLTQRLQGGVEQFQGPRLRYMAH
ncbi:hypothetical protein BH23GEM3_BH23GEM3_12900 [soil metagenome]